MMPMFSTVEYASKALEVVLGKREEDTPDPGHDSDSDQQPAPPCRCGGKIGQRADQAVDPDLDHRTRHDGGDVARRCGMSLREPDVQRHEPRLGAEADDGEQEQDTGGRRRSGSAAMAAKSSEPADPASKTKKTSRKAVPRCVATRYVRPASRTSSSSSSNVTRKYEVSDITSHATRNNTPLRAEHHQNHAGDQRVKKEPVVPEGFTTSELLEVLRSVDRSQAGQPEDRHDEPR